MSDARPTGRDGDALARWTDAALRQVPSPTAPAGLAADVMARVRRESKVAAPPFRSSWRDWPTGARWCFAMGMAGLAGWVAWRLELVVPASWDGAAHEGIADAIRFAGGLYRALSKVAGILGGFHGRLPGPWTAALLVMLGALWASVAGLGSVIWRFSREQA